MVKEVRDELPVGYKNKMEEESRLSLFSAVNFVFLGTRLSFFRN